VRFHGISDLIDRFYGRIGGGVESNGKIGAGNVFINGTGNAYAWYIELLTKGYGTPKGAISTNDDQPVYASFL
jgi:hypothetical protein